MQLTPTEYYVVKAAQLLIKRKRLVAICLKNLSSSSSVQIRYQREMREIDERIEKLKPDLWPIFCRWHVETYGTEPQPDGQVYEYTVEQA